MLVQAAFKKFAVAMVGTMAAVTIVGSAKARDVSVVNGFPPGSLIERALTDFTTKMGEQTSLRGKVYSMSLLSLMETSAGLRDGLADIGYVLTGYFPSEFPNANLVGDMNMLSTTGTATAAPGLAMTGAYTEFVALNCPECQDEIKAQNQVFLGGGSSTEHVMVCRKPVTSLEDLRNMKLRVNSNMYGRWAESVGAVKVAVPGAEMYEALSQGVADCLIVSVPEINNWRLYEVAKHVYGNAPGGVYANVAPVNVNRELWRELSAEDRAAMLKLGTFASAAVSIGYIEEAEKALAVAREKGLEISTAPDEVVRKIEEFVAADLPVIADEATKSYGVQNAAERMEVIKKLIEKWKVKVGEIDYTDREKVSQLFWDEIFSKVDASTYGLD